MPTEADTCRKFVLPKLYSAGWSDEQISERRTFIDGRIVVHGDRATRRKGRRADRLKKQQAVFFGCFAPEAREILNDLLEKYAADGELQFTLPNMLKVPPISQHGNVAEIARVFGGEDHLRNAVNQLQTLLYAA